MRLDYRSDSAQDAGFLLLLGVVAMYGLHNSFTGVSYLAAGLVGLGLGVALAELIKRFRQPLIVLALSVVVAFFILGGVVSLHNLGGTALLPVPHTLSQLASAAVHGWKNMLTTLPPVDNGPLLALPYLLGLVAGASGMVVADRTHSILAPVIVLAGLLAVVILMGSRAPSQTIAVGAVFACSALAWLMVRAQRTRPHYFSGGSVRLSRRLSGTVLCVGAAVLAGLLGTHVPGMGSTRTVLRSSVVPPFNVDQYPSPLSGFRRFTKGYSEVQPDSALYNTRLFKVSGLPAGSLIRIATLDSYDGNVWGAGDVAGGSTATAPTQSDTFQKVGQVIDNPQRGTEVTATVKILNDALGVWVPTSGGLTGITFSKPNAQLGTSEFRYNLATSTGVVPQGLTPGDSYTFQAVLPDSALGADTQLASGDLAPGYNQFQLLATRWAGHAASSLQQIEAVASYLRANGHYTDGGIGYQSFAAGHSLYRLQEFLSSSGELAGDDEQFSALMALMANELNVPARVVLGADVPSNGIVTGADVHAWVELQAANGIWKTLPVSEFMGTLPPKKQSEKSPPSVPSTAIPPPAPVLPPANAGESLTNTVFHRVQGSKVTHHHVLPRAVTDVVRYVGVPVGAIILLCALVIGLKLGRRTYRRRHGSPAHRLVYAWRDLLDHARDFGIVAPTKATRREQAAALGFPAAVGSASTLDSVMFGYQPPDDQAATNYWLHADRLRREFAQAHSPWRRLRAAVSLSTLRPRRTPPQ